MIRRGSNTKGTPDTVSNGSVIHVYPNQFMMLVDGGKVVDYTAEEGYYTVNNSSLPSLFNGQFGDTLKESFQRLNTAEAPLRSRKYFLSISRRSRGSSSAPAIPSTISTSFITRSCFCGPTELIP